MKHILIVLCAISAAVLLSSCSGPNARDLYDEGRAAEDSAKYILALEKYDEVVTNYPAEAVAETAMYRSVMIRANAPGDKSLAIGSQMRFLELFPASQDAPKVMFMLAFLYNNELGRTDSAKKYYEQFLAAYPAHELAPSAKFELETLGMGPAELLEGGNDAPAVATGKEGSGGQP